MSGERPKICIVSLYAWPIFERSSRGAFGGSEVRIATIARGLARRGRVDVQLVVWDHGQEDGIVQEGIRFRSWPEPAPSPIPVPNEGTQERFKPSRWTRAQRDRGGWRAVVFAPLAGAFDAYAAFHRTIDPWRRRLRAAGAIGPHLVDRARFAFLDGVEADVFVVHGANSTAADVVFWCKSRGKPSLMIAGSDIDFDSKYLERPNERNLYGDYGAAQAFVVANATAVAVQTEHQASLLKKVYGRDGTVIPNPYDATRAFPREEERGNVLWVGKADSVKRPDLAIELARRLPEARFTLVMNPSNPELEASCRAAASSLPNVTIVPFVPFSEIERLFARASVFLNTSAFEGFPNTFLQSAKYEVPIVSVVVDPAAFVSEGAGIVGGSLDGAEAALKALLADDAARARYGAAGLRQLRARHDMEHVFERYEELLMTSLRSKN